MKANILNNQFSSVFNKDENISSLKDKGRSPHPSMERITITENGVRKLLGNLKPHKATGPDEIPTRLLRELSSELAPVLTVFFQTSLDTGSVPSDWKTANVVPIFKKGEKHRPENYRPVSLTSVTCKLLEHIVASSITKHLDKHRILSDAQHGFRKKRSCETQLIETIDDISKSIDNREQVDAILLDFSKAFDKVPHLRLQHKIRFHGITGSTHRWICDFLGERTQQVLLEGTSSNKADVLSGVPQGSVLGPLLFLMYINDLPESVSSKSTVRLFADDCVLYRKICTEEDAKDLQEDLDRLQVWERDWLMEFHPQKCQVLHLSNKRNLVKYPYTIHGQTLEEADSAKYLGIHIHKKMNWNFHIDQVAKKANSTRAFLQRNIKQFPKSTKELCYKTLLRPLMEYASVIWDPFTQNHIRKLEMVQRRYARFVMRDYRTTSSVTSMLQQLQWPSLQERRAQSRVVMMYRIVHLLVDIPQENLIQATTLRGHSQRFLVPFARTSTYQRSFYPDGIRLWNTLPQTVIDCTSLQSFKKEVQQSLLR